LVTPQDGIDRDGTAEIEFFKRTTPIPTEETERLAALVLFELVPALSLARYREITAALRQLQDIGMKRREWEIQPEGVRRVQSAAYANGADCVALSSMGPTLAIFSRRPLDLYERLSVLGAHGLIVSSLRRRGIRVYRPASADAWLQDEFFPARLSLCAPPRASLVIVGYSGSGKTSVAQELSSATGVPVVEVGSVVRSSAGGNDASQSALLHADDVFRNGDVTRFVRRALGNDRQLPVLIVGIRRREELEYVRSRLGRCTVVALTASEDTRRARQALRSGRRLDGGRKEWRERDAVETRWGLTEVIRTADYVVDAEGSLSEVVGVVMHAWSRAS
jgi:dephospho-CoA kinase